MDTWRGRFPITSFVLLALLKKSEAANATFSSAEQTLYAACGFWAATATRELSRHLGSQAEHRLRAGYRAFLAIGAVRVASALRLVIGDCPEDPSPHWVRVHAERLETQLLDGEDAVDELIARYADQHLNVDARTFEGSGTRRRGDADLDES